MKLIMCSDCTQVVSVPPTGDVATCHCGRARASRDANTNHMLVTHNALVFGCDDSDVILVVTNKARNFTTWRIDVPCKTVDFFPDSPPQP